MRKGLTLLLTLLSTHVLATPQLEVDRPYARATPPNAPTSAVFFHAHNPSEKPISIVGAHTNAADTVELHTVIHDGDLMQMRQTPTIEIPANGDVVLKPGGLHIMLIGLTQAFNVGEEIELILTLDDGTTFSVTAPIKEVMSGMSMSKMKHNH